MQVPSPDVSKAKVLPKKPSIDVDREYPEPQEEEELGLHKPKSGIFINVKGEKCLDKGKSVSLP